MKKWFHLAVIVWVLWLGLTINGEFQWFQMGTYEFENQCEFVARHFEQPNETACVEE